MKVIICGAGQVGLNIAAYLSAEGNDVTVIDSDPYLIQEINQNLDVRGITGMASHPQVLENAGAKTADMIIAATYSDEVNMVACQVAHSLFNIPKKIARIRSQAYKDPIWSNLFSRHHMPIDLIISPEIEVARAISERLIVPGSFNVVPMEDGKIQIVGVLALENCPIKNTPISHIPSLFSEIHFKILMIIRDNRPFIPNETDQILENDEVYFVAPTIELTRVMAAFGHDEPEARRVVIFGGGNIGLYLASLIEKSHSKIKCKIIEINEARAQYLNEALPNTIILNGDGLDVDILEEAHIDKTEVVVAVTNDDEANILGSMLAKKFGAKRAITLINKTTYSPLFSSLGLDAVVSPRAITVSAILQYVRRGKIRAIRSLREDLAEVIEIEVTEKSMAANMTLGELDWPSHQASIGLIIRDGEFLIPDEDDSFKAGDRVVILSMQGCANIIENLFASAVEL